MNAYLPSSARLAALVLALMIGTLLVGLSITRSLRGTAGRVAAWTLAIVGAAGAERLTAAEPAGFRMLALCSVVLFAMKAVVSVEHQRTAPGLGAGRWLCFAATWPGMRPEAFTLHVQPPSASPTARQLVEMGLRRVALGAALIGLARLAWLATGSRALATALVLPGLSLLAHFGAFNVLAGIWRGLGADTAPLFVAPLFARDLREFWGRRWNLAFSEMTRSAVHRPLVPLLGKRAATTASFLFSGLLHELAISVPVRAGFGLPLLYFALHGGAMALEDALARRGKPIAAVRWVGHAWTLAWLALPMPILFHPAFLRGVVWPILGISG